MIVSPREDHVNIKGEPAPNTSFKDWKNKLINQTNKFVILFVYLRNK